MKRLTLFLSVIALIVAPISLFAQDDEDGLYVTEDGAFAVFLPDDWLATGDAEGLFVATSAETLELIQDESDELPVIDSGEIGIVVVPFSFDLFEFFDLETTASPVEIAEALLADEEEDVSLVGEITEVEVGGFPAAMIHVSQAEGELVAIIHRLGPTVLGTTGVVVGDNAFDDVIEDIISGLGEVNYSLPLEEFYEDGANSVLYPAGWTSNDELIEDALIITNVPEYLELEDAELQSDEVVYVLFDVSDIAAENDNDLEATVSAFAEQFLEEGDEAGEPAIIAVQERHVAGLSVTSEVEGQAEGGVAVTEGPDGQFYGILYATADNEGDLVIWTGVQILLSINSTEGIEG